MDCRARLSSYPLLRIRRQKFIWTHDSSGCRKDLCHSVIPLPAFAACRIRMKGKSAEAGADVTDLPTVSVCQKSPSMANVWSPTAVSSGNSCFRFVLIPLAALPLTLAYQEMDQQIFLFKNFLISERRMPGHDPLSLHLTRNM